MTDTKEKINRGIQKQMKERYQTRDVESRSENQRERESGKTKIGRKRYSESESDTKSRKARIEKIRKSQNGQQEV